MKRSIIYFGFILWLLSQSSCKKDKEQTGNSDQLLKIVLVDSAKPAKSVRVYEYIYDNKNRLTEITFSYGDSVGGALELRTTRSAKCHYNGAETTPYLSNGFGFPIGGPDSDVYHLYDKSGVLLKDSMPDFRPNGNPGYNYYTQEYMYGKNSVITKGTNAFTSPNFPDIHYDSIAINNHNITGRYTLYYPGNPTLQGFQYAYDNKINPLSRLNIRNFLIQNSVENSLTPGYSSNNVTKWESGFFNNGQFIGGSVFILTYTYNNKGLPVECKVSGAPFPYTIKYFYK